MLGLRRGVVELVEHDKAWDEAAARACLRLKEIFGPEMLDAQHVGSTSIKGIKAKPIVDIAVGVRALPPVLGKVAEMASAGFWHKPENDNEWQVFFSCYGEDKDIVTHHIHVVVYEGEEWANYIAFRDYLNENREMAEEYEKLKLSLMKDFPKDRDTYTESKAEFIKGIIRKARGTE